MICQKDFKGLTSIRIKKKNTAPDPENSLSQVFFQTATYEVGYFSSWSIWSEISSSWIFDWNLYFLFRRDQEFIAERALFLNKKYLK